MKPFLFFSVLLFATVSAQRGPGRRGPAPPQPPVPAANGVPATGPPPPPPLPQGAPHPPPSGPPKINWGLCPQLEPSESEKESKAKVLQGCIRQIEFPKNVTEETVDEHRKAVAFCALKTEQWISGDGKYKYEKAEQEIKAKGLTAQVQAEIMKAHKKCQQEAKQLQQLIQEIQLYQSCMDFHIGQICRISITTQ